MRQARCGSAGVALLEALVALLLVVTAISGLMTTHLAARRIHADVAGHTVASALAAGMLERALANEAGRAVYPVEALGDPDAARQAPSMDCSAGSCTPAQLAAFDLWHFEAGLLGRWLPGPGAARGPLHRVRACVAADHDAVRVAVVWRGRMPRAAAGEPACPAVSAGLYDDPAGEPGNARLRREVVLSARWGRSP